MSRRTPKALKQLIRDRAFQHCRSTRKIAESFGCSIRVKITGTNIFSFRVDELFH